MAYVPGPANNGVTLRAILIGIALALLYAPVGFYIEVVVGGGPGEGVPARMPVFFLFALTLLMGSPGLRRAGLTRRELLVVYAMLLAGLPLAHRAVIFYLHSKTVIYYYLSRAFPAWDAAFIPYVPTWWAPSQADAVNGFFAGQSQPPWRLWWLPLSAWSSFMFCLWLASVCALIIVQRQWIENERLTFPVAQIPLDMVSQPAQAGAAGRLTRQRLFWFGLLASVLYVGMDSLRAYVPAVPAIPIFTPLTTDEPRGIFQGVQRLMLYLPPSIIGLMYLVPKEVSFSCWFFWLAHQGVTVAANIAGITAQEGSRQQSFLPASYQGIGAVYGLLLFVLFVGRRHILGTIKLAFGHRTKEAGDDSATLYRWAFIGLVLTTAWMLYFCWLSGCRLIVGILFLGLTVGFYVLWARLRAETGFGGTTFPTEITSVMTEPMGSAWLRPREIVTLFTMRWATWVTSDATVGVCTGHALDAFKIASAARIPVSRLTWAMMAGFLVTLAAGSLVFVKGMYHYGFFGTFAGDANYWPSLQSRQDGAAITQLLTNPQQPLYNTMPAMLVGAALAIGLALLRLRLWWWPFHPIGFIVANAPDMGWYFFTFLVPWLLKVMAIRFGGLRLYRQTVPLAVGFIVGDLLSGTLWAVVGLIVRASS
jgi:hypothetical protein